MNSEETKRRQQIIEAAFVEFARKGFRGATIKSIAKAARLQAPSLIYWYFPTKEALFQAVMESRSPFFRRVFEPGALLEQPPEEVLNTLARSFFEMIEHQDVPPLARLIFSEVVRRPQMADMIAENFLLRVLDFLKDWLKNHILKVDAELSAFMKDKHFA